MHLGARGCELRPLGLLSTHQGKDTPRLLALRGQGLQGRTRYGCKGLMLGARMNRVP